MIKLKIVVQRATKHGKTLSFSFTLKISVRAVLTALETFFKKIL